MQTTRRVFVRHTAGPYPGLLQMVGLLVQGDDGAEVRRVDNGVVLPLARGGDVLNGQQLGPDGRISNLLRLRSTDRWVLYQEAVAAA
jgi:hypothetical protein